MKKCYNSPKIELMTFVGGTQLMVGSSGISVPPGALIPGDFKPISSQISD